MSYSYDQIKPLIVSANAESNQMICEFALPGSDEIIGSKAPIRRSTGATSQVTRQVQRTLVNEVKRTASRLLRSIFGGGIVGRTARTAVTSATTETGRNMANAPSRVDKEAAIVAAFEKVSNNFHYNEDDGSWGAPIAPPTPKEPTPFEQQLNGHPIASAFDKNVLARILAQVAYADGDLADEEREFFEDSIPAEVGTVTDLANSDPVSTVEAEEIHAGVRGSIYMLAWTISLIDMDINPKEEELLNEVANKFGFSAEDANAYAALARAYVLENYFTEDMRRDEVFELGAKVGLSNEDAERALIRWKKRQ